MNEWSQFAAKLAPKEPAECVVTKFLLTLPKEGQSAVLAALDGDTPIPAIRDAIRAVRPGYGMPSETSWRYHRRGVCICTQAVQS